MNLKALRLLAAEKGLRYTFYYWLRVEIPALKVFADRRLRRLDPDFNVSDQSAARNFAKWQAWNWDQKGDEWTSSPRWKQSLVDEVLRKHMEGGGAVLEIGPGFGRWTEFLQPLAERLVLVDLTDKCIGHCRQRFADCENMEYFVNDGRSLAFLEEGSIDRVWSYDVFVHIAPVDIENYLVEIQRVLKMGGRAVIHHAAEGGRHGGWRSRMTSELMRDMVLRHGFLLVDQFDSWGDEGQFDIRYHRDVITVFEK